MTRPLLFLACLAVGVGSAVAVDLKTLPPAEIGPKRAVRNALEFRPVPTGEYVVILRETAPPSLLAASSGLQILETSISNSRFVRVAGPVAQTLEQAEAYAAQLLRNPLVESAYADTLIIVRPRAFVPNDPLYPPGTPIGSPGQWYLNSRLSPKIDANILGAWNQNRTGQGVLVGVIDDGLDHRHPDLQPNYSAVDSYDFEAGDPNPLPGLPSDYHGTSVAGVIAARGGNGIGVTGAAPFARLAGIRHPFNLAARQQALANAITWRSSGSIRTIKLKNHSYGVRGNYIPLPLAAAAVRTSAAAGTINVWAAGNFRQASDPDVGAFMLESLPEVVNVAALGSSGKFATYSSYGSSLIVTAPTSSGRPGEAAVTTTDLPGNEGGNVSGPYADYNFDFGGTSASAPLVTGVLALAKQANPALNTRMAKHLLVRTSRVVDPTDNTTTGLTWRVNGAGRRFNHNYGFGNIDATKLVMEAPRFSGVSPLTIFNTPLVNVNAPIPDASGSTAGVVERTFNVAQTTPLEEVQLTVAIEHTFRGDLEIFLTSPRGMVSRLIGRNTADAGANVNWTFTSNAFWGENPQGLWRISVRDTAAQDTGRWLNYRLSFRMGTLLSGRPLSVTTTPTNVLGGTAVAGRVTIDRPAPTGGVRVALRSSHPSAPVPAFVTVPTGGTQVAFTIRTTRPAATVNATITATANLVSRSSVLTVRR